MYFCFFILNFSGNDDCCHVDYGFVEIFGSQIVWPSITILKLRNLCFFGSIVFIRLVCWLVDWRNDNVVVVATHTYTHIQRVHLYIYPYLLI